MRLLKNTSFIAAALVAAFGVTSLGASAQSFHVPFQFEAAGKTLPAGDYEISRDLRGDFVNLISRDHASSYTFVLHPGEEGHHGVSLLFDRNGSAYELNSIAVDGKATGKLDHRTASEREVRGE